MITLHYCSYNTDTKKITKSITLLGKFVENILIYILNIFSNEMVNIMDLLHSVFTNEGCRMQFFYLGN